MILEVLGSRVRVLGAQCSLTPNTYDLSPTNAGGRI